MFARPYSSVTVEINGTQPQRWTVPRDDRHDFAADRYVHYLPELGAYIGTLATAGELVDRFERGTITIEN